MNTYDNQATPETLPTAHYRAIRTRFAGPTNTRGSRVIADAGDRASRIVVDWNHALNSEQNHAYAAVLVTRKMGWVGEFYSPLVGGAYGMDTYWVFQPKPALPYAHLAGTACQGCGMVEPMGRHYADCTLLEGDEEIVAREAGE